MYTVYILIHKNSYKPLIILNCKMAAVIREQKGESKGEI